MKINFIKNYALMAIVGSMILLQSCEKDPDPIIKAGEAGFFIVNEGGFPNPNTSISYYDRTTGTVSNDLFVAKNGRPLGLQAQSMTVFESKGYIVVQGDSKIEIINPNDFSSLATISEGIPSPRYFLGVTAAKAYVSDWGADGVTGTVKVIDLSTNKVTKTIATGKGANRMLKVGNLVYIANAGGYDTDNTVKVIDSGTDAVIASITTGDNPNSLQQDKEGNIWVACDGNEVYKPDFSIDEAKSTKGSISKITSANTEAKRFTVDQVTYSGPANLGISPDGTQLYYTFDGAVYSMSTTATALPTSSFKTKSYYGLSVDPFNGNIIGCNATNFSSAGSIDVYDATGALLNTFTVGIAPNGCAFK